MPFAPLDQRNEKDRTVDPAIVAATIAAAGTATISLTRVATVWIALRGVPPDKRAEVLKILPPIFRGWHFGKMPPGDERQGP
jgi:hypothetical protein